MNTEQQEGVLKAVNELAKHCDTNKISDGYHTFGELYEHRIALFIALCREFAKKRPEETAGEKMVWKLLPKDGWFVMGISFTVGKQITYHLPESKWDETQFAWIPSEYNFDGHTSNDVLERLKLL
jgi:hypothetical protein